MKLDASDRAAGMTCWSDDSIIAPIHTMDIVDTMTHEMVHALQWAAYKSFPLCITEGMADWLADSYTHSTRNVRDFYHKTQVLRLAQEI